MTSEIALDAALREEPGGEKVTAAIGRARMSAVNFAEVVSYLASAGMPSDRITAMLTPLPVVVVAADVELAGSTDVCARRQPRRACRLEIAFVWRSRSGRDCQPGQRTGNGARSQGRSRPRSSSFGEDVER